MLGLEHNESKQWLLDTLTWFEDFVKNDEDYIGDRDYEVRAVHFQHAVVRDGKYRVVFLGAFNVGKSTAINAFLGGPYLPMDVEECTSKLTYIQRGEDLRLGLNLEAMASPHELESLERILSGRDMEIESSPDKRNVTIRCIRHEPESMRAALEPLITVAADEEYPHLASLRDKIDAITLYLPSETLEKDIVFIDTPGVHSMSETRQKITYDIIEQSHLVICFVDSGFVGNIHDLNFIKRIITCRGRRVFFVLNKADKLNSEEIDPLGGHGPAAQLREAFQRHDMGDDADIFFLSGYRALQAIELDNNRSTLADTLEDNKLLIPTAVVERITRSMEPPKDLAAYLMGQSRFPHLKERLMAYLINENRANTVFELADRFVHERANDYLISICNALALARDPAKFEELRANREMLLERTKTIRAEAEAILERYRIGCRGGVVEGKQLAGYVEQVQDLLTEEAIETQVVAPVLAWLREGDNLKDVRRQRFKPLSAQLEHQVDIFVTNVQAQLCDMIAANEKAVTDAMAAQIGSARDLRARMTEPDTAVRAAVEGSVSGEYAAFGAGGAVVGAMTGMAVGSAAPVIGTAIGAGVGGLLGAVVGFIARLAWSGERWIKKLTPAIRKNALVILRGNEDNETTPVIRGLTRYVERRATVFEDAVRGEVGSALDAVQRECDVLIAREEEIRRERDAVIARLEPKEARLMEIRAQAEKLLTQSEAAC